MNTRCGARELPSWGCGHERLTSRFKFYECDLPEDHEGAHQDSAAYASWARDDYISPLAYILDHD